MNESQQTVFPQIDSFMSAKDAYLASEQWRDVRKRLSSPADRLEQLLIHLHDPRAAGAAYMLQWIVLRVISAFDRAFLRLQNEEALVQVSQATPSAPTGDPRVAPAVPVLEPVLWQYRDPDDESENVEWQTVARTSLAGPGWKKILEDRIAHNPSDVHMLIEFELVAVATLDALQSRQHDKSEIRIDSWPREAVRPILAAGAPESEAEGSPLPASSLPPYAPCAGHIHVHELLGVEEPDVLPAPAPEPAPTREEKRAQAERLLDAMVELDGVQWKHTYSMVRLALDDEDALDEVLGALLLRSVPERRTYLANAAHRWQERTRLGMG